MRSGKYWSLIGSVFLVGALSSASTPGRDGKSIVRLRIPGYSPNSLPFQIAEDQGFYNQQRIGRESLRMKTGAGVPALLGGSSGYVSIDAKKTE